jgi:hypothetical protein
LKALKQSQTKSQSRRTIRLLDAYGYTGDRTAIRDAIIGRAECDVAMIRQFADGGEPVFQLMLPWPRTWNDPATKWPACRTSSGRGWPLTDQDQPRAWHRRAAERVAPADASPP